jgi:hypothetical protein
VRAHGGERFGVVEQPGDQRVRQRRGELAVGGRIGRRMVAVPAAQGDLPAVAVHRERHAEPRPRRRVGDAGEQQPVELAGAAAQHPGGVADVDPNPVLCRRRQLEPVKPPVRAGASGRVDHQVRARLPAVVGFDAVDALSPHADQRADVGALDQGDVSPVLDPSPDEVFEQGSGGADHRDAAVVPGAERAQLPERDVLGGVGPDGAVGGEFVGEAGEKVFEGVVARDEECVRVVPLRDTGTVVGPIGKPVTFDDRHPVGAIGDDAGRGEPGDAGTDDDDVHRSSVPH